MARKFSLHHVACSATVGLVLATGFAPGAVLARDLGTFGELFLIAEPDLMALIQSKVAALVRSDGLHRMEEDAQAKARSFAEAPPGRKLPRAKVTASRTFDPAVTLNRDLADQNGQVFAAAGTAVNPLAWSQFRKAILFIDGDDADQVAWALAQGDETNSLIVLTSGRPLELSRRNGRRFWFDQNAVLSTRFQIAKLPSRVTRADPFLLIQEVALPVRASSKGSPQP
jgi:conjugal transfer pilus assembly protein TraW